MEKDFIEELTWRGMLHDSTPEVAEHLNLAMRSGYIGFDPTADSLHVGNLVPIMILVHFQRSGHKPFALVGGATGMVGDPSGKSQERKLLDEETLRHNQACIQTQLERFLDFENGANKAEIVNNYDWFKNMNFLDFIRNVGKHISVNYMMAKDSVKNRLETGLSFTEFSYQLVQGYDFFWLYKNRGITLQMGGSDQWGNITTGTELIRRMDGGEAYAVTTPLLTKSDGSKFGKSEAGNVWLDAERTSPYKFYQFWLNVSDDDAEKQVRIFTTWERSRIDELIIKHREAPGQRLLQKAVAADITERVHGEAQLEMAQEATRVLFGKGQDGDLGKLSQALIEDVFEGVPQGKVSKDSISGGVSIVDLLSEKTGFLSSKGEARRALKEGSVSVNRMKVDDGHVVSTNDLLRDRYLLLQRGKKKYFLVEVV
jgi:tyrosyl-tRNA synthetase